MEITACTIIARNYLPAARVVARSFREHNPGATFTTLIVDDITNDIEQDREPFNILRLDDIGLDHEEVLRMAAIYDVTELCTAVKPWLLETLLNQCHGVVIYLDPDIKVYASFGEIVRRASDHGIVLTPHVTKPMPRDGLSKSETEVLLSGIYNLGFIAVSRNVEEFLDFWKARLSRECIVDPQNMRFVDQRWIDFVPGLFPTYILREPTYNVAYWNLADRSLVYTTSGYLVDGSPLHFFHFSGYSPDTPYLLSKHQGHRPRILLSKRPDVARICDEYRVDLLANGYGECGATEYGFKRLANGVVFDRFMRRLYRSALLEAERTGSRLPANPLEAGNETGFLSWLAERPDERPDARLSRYVAAIHAERADLQRAFPDPEGINLDAFATWLRHEVHEGRLDSRLANVPDAPGRARLRLSLAMQLGRVERRLAVVPVPGTGNVAVRLNMAGAVRQLERTISAAPVPKGAERTRLNLSRSLGRLERRLSAVPVPGTANERVRLNVARSLAHLERRLAPPPTKPLGERRGSVSAESQASPGVRVAGYLRTESGIGELGRLALAVVKRTGVATSTYVDTNAVSRQNHAFEPYGGDMNVNLVCVNADELPNFAKRVGEGFFKDHYTIGLWAWELEEFPARFSLAFNYVDEVWSISDFARRAIAAASDKPVYSFPLPIVVPQVPLVNKGALGLPDRFTFLFCFDLLSIFERKNPLGLIEAFRKAFRSNEGPVLVIKVINGELELGSLERLRVAASGRPDIIIMDGYLNPEKNLQLMAACDCYVSLHRSEGFGLTLAEAMALGKPVIATGYSGNLEFMTSDTSYLVPWAAGKVPAGCSPYRAGAVWAEPDLGAAAAFMREVFEDPLNAEERGRRAQAHVLTNHGLDARTDFVSERFRIAQVRLAQGQAVRTSAGADERLASAVSLVEVMQRPRSLEAPSSHPRAARVFRRFVWRVLRSHDDHDRELHKELAKGVEGVRTEVERLRDEYHEALSGEGGAALRSELTAQRRRLDVLGVRLEDLERPERWRDIEEAVRTASELRAVPFMTDPAMLSTTDDQGRAAIGYRGGAGVMGGYAAFEDVFRGSEEMISQRLKPYLGILGNNAPVLDVGCGRGELLDLLAGAGVPATGVDMDASMVERARKKGHKVVHGDGVEYLATLESYSLGTVFAAQVVEHLSADEIARLLKEARRVLRPEGVVLFETVNPYSVQAFKAFWTDLTHRNPIYPEALVVYCAEAGFAEALVMFPHGNGDLAQDRWSEGEYAVLARTPPE